MRYIRSLGRQIFAPVLLALVLCLGAERAVARAAEPTSVPGSNATPAKANGPLRVHPINPRYFTDGSGKVVFLTGSHTWGNFQDYTYDSLPSPAPMNFDGYLKFLQQHGHNFLRLWVWETSFNPGAKQGTITYSPLPYPRIGPGLALDGSAKFDLGQFDQQYFDRLRTRVMAAANKGIYVSVMLFNGFSVEGKGNVNGDPWSGHPFNGENNINGVHPPNGQAVHTLGDPAVTRYHEAYLRKVIDTVNDLDNVLFEITNEDSGTAADITWQIYLVQLIKRYERAKTKQHPVGMTACWPNGRDELLRNSPADWISPTARFPLADRRKVVLNDTDHSYFWTDLRKDGPEAQRAWVWKNFTLGNQCLFMDPYLDPSHDPGRNEPAGRKPDPYWDVLRDAMGQTRAMAERIDLANAVPHPELASTRFCLANPGKEYLVYLPSGGEVKLDLSAASGPLNAEWVRPREALSTPSESVSGSGERVLTAPFTGDALLHLWAK